MPFFSIITPTYNSEQTLQKCLESILCQSFNDFEILIMDGVSTDSTLEIAKSFNDARIKVFSEKDESVYDAMNKGIEQASGEWLYFLGSDDELYDNNVLENVWKEISNDCYDLIYGDAVVIDKSNNYVWGGEFDRKKLTTHGYGICHQAIFYKKNLFDSMGKYNLQFKIWADWDFNIRCFSNPEIKIKHMPLIIANYNNLFGISTDVIDDEFAEFLPYYAKQNIRNSKSYRLGYSILKPLKFLLRKT